MEWVTLEVVEVVFVVVVEGGAHLAAQQVHFIIKVIEFLEQAFFILSDTSIVTFFITRG